MMKIDCSRQVWPGQTDRQIDRRTLALLGLLSEPKNIEKRPKHLVNEKDFCHRCMISESENLSSGTLLPLMGIYRIQTRISLMTRWYVLELIPLNLKRNKNDW